VLGLPETLHDCFFGVDEVLTGIASAHTKAWKAVFGEYLSRWATGTGDQFVPFGPIED
jgi:beta-phosphoglucomutase-like phosphatase (HAD superfamily)